WRLQMSAGQRDDLRRGSSAALLAAVAAGVLFLGASRAMAQGSPGPGADACGPVSAAPPTGTAAAEFPIFPQGQYPVKLPAMSLLGAPNDLPNSYNPGVDWGQLPAGRKWGSTASVSTGPDGTIWVADRCGN